MVKTRAREEAPGIADEVLAWMLFHDLPQQRAAYFARLRLSAAERGAGTASAVEVATADLRALLGAGDWAADAEAASREGSVAGALLWVVWQMRNRGDAEPSMNKAMREVYAKWGLTRRFGDGEPLPRSKQTMHDAWRRRAPVAHFWAALEVSKLSPSPYPCGQREIFASAPGFDMFLAISRAFGDFATSFVVKRAKPPVPLIRPGTLIPVPGGTHAPRFDLTCLI
jgi:hypothetical protein